jgi:hypothetical protein
VLRPLVPQGRHAKSGEPKLPRRSEHHEAKRSGKLRGDARRENEHEVRLGDDVRSHEKVRKGHRDASREPEARERVVREAPFSSTRGDERVRRSGEARERELLLRERMASPHDTNEALVEEPRRENPLGAVVRADRGDDEVDRSLDEWTCRIAPPLPHACHWHRWPQHRRSRDVEADPPCDRAAGIVVACPCGLEALPLC